MTDEEFRALKARARELGVPQSRLMGALILDVEPGWPERLAALEARVERLESRV